jgi:sugar/nucleoside kinase (ribokinase family)
VNEAEARQLCRTYSVLRAGREILAMGPRAVIVKRGEYGAVLFMKERVFWSPAYPLEDVRDPTGAGDAFAGGMLGHLATAETIDDREICRAVLHGAVCASFAVSAFSVDGVEKVARAEIEGRVRELGALAVP